MTLIMAGNIIGWIKEIDIRNLIACFCSLWHLRCVTRLCVRTLGNFIEAKVWGVGNALRQRGSYGRNYV
jgi:hypothetical protein